MRRIFELCATGTGLTRIAKTLNAERAVSPRPQQARPAGWSPSTVRDVLHRTLYRGEVLWNRSRKRDTWGQHRQQARPAAEWLRVDAPNLRVVSEEAWEAAHSRLRGIRARLETAQGDRPIVRRDIDSAYLLSGFARCASCGGALSVVSRQHGRRRVFFYGCLAHAKRGREVFANALVMPVPVVEDAVLRAMAGDVLRPRVVTAILDAVFDALKPTETAATVKGLRSELQALDQRIARLTAAVENGSGGGAPGGAAPDAAG